MEQKRNLPIGAGEAFHAERGKERLPALEVKNTVIWVNPAFKGAPFRLKLGKPSDFGVFFTPKPERYPTEKAKNLTVMPEWGRGRSGLFGEAIFQDKEGRLYRDIDVKGIGVFEKVEIKAGYYRVGAVWSMGDPLEANGLMDYDFALCDRNYSEKFLKAGIRTHRVVEISDLEEIIDTDGVKISIEEAKKGGIIPKDMHPVAEVRAFGTKERIEYLHLLHQSPERLRGALEDAKAIVAEEQGVNPKEFSFDQYLAWFAKTLGTQVAKIRKLKLYHHYLTSHNITLDCRIVDLDSVRPIGVARLEEQGEIGKRVLTDEDLYGHDRASAVESLQELINQISSYVTDEHDGTDYVLLYETAYQAELTEKRMNRKNGQK